MNMILVLAVLVLLASSVSCNIGINTKDHNLEMLEKPSSRTAAASALEYNDPSKKLANYAIDYQSLEKDLITNLDLKFYQNITSNCKTTECVFHQCNDQKMSNIKHCIQMVSILDPSIFNKALVHQGEVFNDTMFKLQDLTARWNTAMKSSEHLDGQFKTTFSKLDSISFALETSKKDVHLEKLSNDILARILTLSQDISRLRTESRDESTKLNELTQKIGEINLNSTPDAVRSRLDDIITRLNTLSNLSNRSQNQNFKYEDTRLQSNNNNTPQSATILDHLQKILTKVQEMAAKMTKLDADKIDHLVNNFLKTGNLLSDQQAQLKSLNVQFENLLNDLSQKTNSFNPVINTRPAPIPIPIINTGTSGASQCMSDRNIDVLTKLQHTNHNTILLKLSTLQESHDKLVDYMTTMNLNMNGTVAESKSLLVKSIENGMLYFYAAVIAIKAFLLLCLFNMRKCLKRIFCCRCCGNDDKRRPGNRRYFKDVSYSKEDIQL